MRKLISLIFLSMIIVVVCCIIVLSFMFVNKVKDEDFKVKPYIMETTPYSKYRLKDPFVASEQVSVERMKEMLIRQFMVDYLEIVPVKEEMEFRMNIGQDQTDSGRTFFLNWDSSKKVREIWKEYAKDYVEKSEKGILRRVQICREGIEKVPNSSYEYFCNAFGCSTNSGQLNAKKYLAEYYNVKLKLITYETNLKTPIVEYKTFYISVIYDKNNMRNISRLVYRLNPLLLFDFAVISVEEIKS